MRRDGEAATPQSERVITIKLQMRLLKNFWTKKREEREPVSSNGRLQVWLY